MSHQPDRVHLETANQGIEIHQVIKKMIVTAGSHPTAVAMTTAVGCQEPRTGQSSAQLSHEKIPASAMIAKPMNQNDGPTLRLTPLDPVNVESTDPGAVMARAHRFATRAMGISTKSRAAASQV